MPLTTIPGVSVFSRYGLNTVPNTPVWVGANLILVPDTPVSLVPPQYRYPTLPKVRYDLNTGTQHIGKFGMIDTDTVGTGTQTAIPGVPVFAPYGLNTLLNFRYGSVRT